MRAVTRGEAIIGVLPIENSLAGAIPETYDLLAHAPLAIVAEAVSRCRTAWWAPGHQHRRAHPGAFPPRRTGPVPPLPLVDPRHAARGGARSTPAAARRVAENGDQREAAIASRRIADKHGLVVLLNDVSDHAENYTRFVAVAAHTRSTAQRYRLAHRGEVRHPSPARRAGAGHQPLAEYGVNMTSLQSRPIHGRPWDYQFYADLEGHPLDPKLAQALRTLASNVAEMSYLGCFPAAPRP